MTKHRDGLLPRMEARPWKCGSKTTYRFKPLGGKAIDLGTDLPQAIRKVLDMAGRGHEFGTVKWLWEQWQLSPRWKRLAEGTQADYTLAWKQIDPHLGGCPAASVTSNQIARYVHLTRVNSPRRANIEKALLSNMFKHGILLDVCSINPTIGVEAHPSEASDVMPEAQVLATFLDWLEVQTEQRRIIGYMAEFAALAGSRRVEFLDLTWPQVDRTLGIIRLKRAKQRGKKRGEVIEHVSISPRMSALLDRIQALGRGGLYLFPTRDGNAYNDRGFKTLWQKCVLAAITVGKLTADTRFNFHALRRYYATKHKDKYLKLPDLHANPQVTAAVYDGTRVVPRRAL